MENLLPIFKEIIIILSSIGTFLSALFAVWTIVEIKKQRESAYRPEIMLDSFLAHLFWDRALSDDSFFYYKIDKIKQNNEGEILNRPRKIYIDYILQNIGLGTAKYIKCNWVYDIQKALNILSSVLPTELEIENDGEESYLIRNTNNGSIQYLSFFQEGVQSIDYILPETLGRHGKGEVLPEIVANILTYYLVYKYKLYLKETISNSLDDFAEFPTLSVFIEYLDVANKVYYKEFALKFKFSGTEGHPQSEEQQLGLFYITVNEKGL
ncbi:hypothetical protein JWG45_15985 [Leptospira sp. 201903070]|uniref:Uncharacterized protein n=1 Tax=Leptospira ainlahdjerensis TaxID=2810033 RepID=A0ABS2UE43_9LEPT|nr:hypothetical protein [Leptospira ainlahdjerensis]MBM9578646.1 hypothetical protein [Leptospira ainlahdjerensis]